MNTFRISHMEAIAQRMMAWVAGVSQKQTDFTVGSRIRTLLEAIAQEIEELNYQLWTGLHESALSALFDGFQFPAKAATRATGTVIFSRQEASPQDYTIPAGTVVATQGSSAEPSRRFLTIADVVLPQGETSVHAAARAEAAGPEYNVTANKIIYIVSTVPGVEAVTNPHGFTNGQAAETDSERAERFRAYINTLQRGTETALVRAIEDGVEDVAGVAVVESPPLFCRRYDASANAFTAHDTEINLPGGTAVTGFPAPPGVNDCLYVGATRRFDMLFFGLRQVGAGVAGVWEYWNGSDWTPIPSVVDNTGAFAASDTVEWEWSDVADWRSNVVNEKKAFWIRFRLTSGVMAIAPTISYAYASPAPGNIIVYAHDGAGTLPDAMKAAIETKVSQYRAAGVKASVEAPTPFVVNVSVTLELAAGADRATVAVAVAAALNSYFANLKVGQRVPAEELSQLVMNTDDDAILDCDWASPTGDVDVSPEQIIRLGTLAVN